MNQTLSVVKNWKKNDKSILYQLETHGRCIGQKRRGKLLQDQLMSVLFVLLNIFCSLRSYQFL